MADSKSWNDKMLEIAKSYQQSYYELLPTWYKYDSTEHKYLKRNIGFALFGPPEASEYVEPANEAIEIIYKKVVEHGKEISSDEIYLGIIYNIIFNDENEQNPKSNQSDPNSDSVSQQMWTIPVFKIRKSLKRKQNVYHHTWYIDNDGRVYKSWADYVSNNTLAESTMVLPKDGIYQANPELPVTEFYSTVWTVKTKSPACSTVKKVAKAIDAASTVIGVGAAIGLGAAAFMSPGGPLIAAGCAAGGINSIWTIGRCSRQLIDRKKHDQSIGVTNKNAFYSWLGIAGSAVGVGASGGSIILTKVIAKGVTINVATRLVFNSLIIGNLTVNGIGVIYLGCRFILKYREKERIDARDAIVLASHILFFSNAVVNTELAGELIRSSRGTIIEEFESNLRSKRFREEYNRIKSSDANNKSDNEEISGIVRQVKKIKTKIELMGGLMKKYIKDNLSLKFVDGKLKLNGVTLLDPWQFVGFLLTANHATGSLSLSFLAQRCVQGFIIQLKYLLADLLSGYIKSADMNSRQLPDINEFNDVLEEVKHMKDGENVLIKVFTMASKILQRSNEPERLLLEAMRFIWGYAKANLKANNMNLSSNSSEVSVIDMLCKIVANIFDIFEEIDELIYNAFYTFMIKTKPLCLTQ